MQKTQLTQTRNEPKTRKKTQLTPNTQVTQKNVIDAKTQLTQTRNEPKTPKKRNLRKTRN